MSSIALATDCRHSADKTPHHGPARLSTIQHRPRAEPV